MIFYHLYTIQKRSYVLLFYYSVTFPYVLFFTIRKRSYGLFSTIWNVSVFYVLFFTIRKRSYGLFSTIWNVSDSNVLLLLNNRISNSYYNWEHIKWFSVVQTISISLEGSKEKFLRNALSRSCDRVSTSSKMLQSLNA